MSEPHPEDDLIDESEYESLTAGDWYRWWVGVIGASILILIALACLAGTVLSIMYFFHGSLETHPNEEQMEKARIFAAICGGISALFAISIGSAAYVTFPKRLKSEKPTPCPPRLSRIGKRRNSDS